MDRVKQADTRIGLLHHVGGGNLGDDATLESVAATKRRALFRRSQQIVGFAPMPFPEPDGRRRTEKDQIAYDTFIGKLASFASFLVDKSYMVIIFGSDIGIDPLVVENRRIGLRSRHRILSSQYSDSVNHSAKSVRELLAMMSRLGYVVTCRFHGLIFAHLLNKPVLAVAYRPKITELVADLELSSYCVDVRNFDAKLLMDEFASMVKNAEEIESCMAAKLTTSRQQLTNQFDRLFGCQRVESLQSQGHPETDFASKRQA
jgi:polysaccharide pyruvyl transferase WcaK-like protein